MATQDSSQAREPAHQHVRSARRSQAHAAKKAAAKLAQVMASHSTEREGDDLHEDYDLHVSTSQRQNNSLVTGSQDTATGTSSRVPRVPGALGSNYEDQSKSPRIRSRSPYNAYGDVQPATGNGISSFQTSTRSPTRFPPTATPQVNAGHRTVVSSSSLPDVGVRDLPSVGALRGRWAPSESNRSYAGGGSDRLKEAALRDEIDLLQEDNEVLLDKLRSVEAKFQEREARNKELEKQIAALDGGISMDARLLVKKESALRQREAALRTAREQTKDLKDDEIAALRLEADSARDEAASATERAFVAEQELQGLRNVTRVKDYEIAALRLEAGSATYDVTSATERASEAEKEIQGLRNVTRVKDDEIAALRLVAGSARYDVVSATERVAVAEKEVQGLRNITRVQDEELAALRLEAGSARYEVASATERASVAEKEVHGLRNVTRRMVLTQDEMEEMVLKRCWLARYWGLATRHNVLSEVASAKHEHWSALAPLPLEVVISAGHSESSSNAALRKSASTVTRDVSDITGEANVEGMLAVEKGLRELALLNVEHAVMISIAQNYSPALDRSTLSSEAIEDVQFKLAWLVYFWRRAKDFKLEKDIAEERLRYWMARSNQPPTSQVAVDVERGLAELHKLGIEEQLWEASRREVGHGAS